MMCTELRGKGSWFLPFNNESFRRSLSDLVFQLTNGEVDAGFSKRRRGHLEIQTKRFRFHSAGGLVVSCGAIQLKISVMGLPW